jgi:hypothetical protein
MAGGLYSNGAAAPRCRLAMRGPPPAPEHRRESRSRAGGLALEPGADNCDTMDL